MSKEQASGDLYEIFVLEAIDPSWSEWLEDFDICRTIEKETKISGRVRDQTALYGLLDQMRDLNLTLISLRKIPLERNDGNDL
jgi:hypothetical protein